ncbi:MULTISPECIES: hypothetical protein [Ignavibacterium]|nr:MULTISPECIES: hypothetical protein [Ignavibacterium]MBI5661733.1 hypothetical protein [Ignavibacterium album]
MKTTNQQNERPTKDIFLLLYFIFTLFSPWLILWQKYSKRPSPELKSFLN